MQNRMKLAFISYYLTYGGIERQITMLANEMCKRGHEVHIISMAGSRVCYDVNSGIIWHDIREKGAGLRSVWNRYCGLKKELAKILPDITIAFMYQQVYLCAFMPKRCFGKLLYAERGDPGADIYRGVLKMLRRITLCRIDGIVFQTKGARNYFGSKIRKKSCIIANPAFLKREDFRSITKRRNVIVNAGRLDMQKNQFLLIRAYAQVCRIYPHYTLEIYGEGNLKHELKMLAQSLGLADKIVFKGTTSNLHNEILDAGMFVLSSDFEGIPNALLEAMALGIPCISTDCSPGGARELITNGEDGLIVPKGDSVKLAQAMIKFIENPDYAESLGENAARRIQRYKPSVIYKKWEQFMMQMCSQDETRAWK